MANAFYTNGLKYFAQGAILWLASGGTDVRIMLVDTTAAYTFSAAHEFQSSVAAGDREATMAASMTLVNAADDGICDASDVTFTGTAGDTCGAIIMYKHTGTDTTSPLIAYWDTAGGLPVTLGGDVTVSWDNGANKVFKI